MAQAPEEPEPKGDNIDVADIWSQVVEKSFCGQTLFFFLNVYWDKYGNEKDDIWTILVKFLEQQEKYGAKGSNIAYPQFCKLLQQLEDSIKRVKDTLAKSGDRSTMGKVFATLGFKLRGDVTLIETLLYLFDEKVETLVCAPQSPGDARLREAKKNLAAVEKESQDLLDQKAKIENDIQQLQKDNAPMKAIKAKQDLAAIDDKINKSKVERQKKLNNAKKELADAEANLAAENKKGTDAANWLKEKCDKAGKKYSA